MLKVSLTIYLEHRIDFIDMLETLVNYCYQHASDSPNPIQDLVDKGLLSPEFNGKTCVSIKQTLETTRQNRLKLNARI